MQLAYNAFGLLIADYQSHAGAVSTGTTPKVQYAYADGSGNHVRPTSLTYPNGRVLTCGYGAGGDTDDAASRVAGLIDNDGTTHLADYSYLGEGTVVEVDYTQPNVRYTLVGTAGGNDPDTGDIYRGLDRFGRVKDLVWYNTTSVTEVERVQHGYDGAGNRLWRRNPVDPNNGHDELYAYDGLYRVKDIQRGTLDAGRTAIFPRRFEQCWDLDATANWQSFRHDDNGDGTWDLVQGQTANKVNEITSIVPSVGPSWVTPTYDPAGNMTTMPQPASPSSSYTATYDAWNRLVKLSAGGMELVGYQYDGLKRRTVKTLYSGGALSSTRHFYYSSAWQLLEERNGSSTNAERQLVWGLRYIDDVILRDRDSGGSGLLNERLYGLQDANWNVTVLADTTGAVQERYEYSAYGAPSVLSAEFVGRPATLFDWDTRYAGYRWDGEDGLYYVRHRYYHPLTGCWVTRDPLGIRSGDNLYQYGASRPTIFFDPTGTKTVFKHIVVKRIKVAWSVVFKVKPEDEVDDAWGHWWIEIGNDESYGWWPKNPVGSGANALKGVPGELNGVTSFEGEETEDPKHGKKGDHSENPFLTANLLRKMQYGPDKGTRCCKLSAKYKGDVDKMEKSVIECIRQAAKDFATKHKTWSYPLGWNCHTFQRWLLFECCVSVSTLWRFWPKKEKRVDFPED